MADSDRLNQTTPIRSSSPVANQSYGSISPQRPGHQIISIPGSPITDLRSDPIDNSTIASPADALGPIRQLTDDSDVYVADTSKDNLLGNYDEEDDDTFEAAPFDVTSESVGEHHDAAHDHPHNSLIRTFINILKGNIGTGILTVPDAVKNAGLFFGTGSFLLLGLLATYCQHQLLHAYVQVADGKPLGYARVVERVFKGAGGRWQKGAKAARRTINAFLCFTQFGFCCVYVLFCARMVKEVIDSQVNPDDKVPIQVYMAGVLALLIPYCLIKTLKALSIFALFGNVVTFATIFIVMQYVCRNLQVVANVDWYPMDIFKLPLFFGTAMFTFESIGLILPIENRMEDRDAFHHWNGLLSATMAFIVSLYCAVGFYGYLAFGNDAKMILSNLPSDDWLYASVKLMYSASIFLSFNLQLYVPIQIIFPTLRRKINKPWCDKYGEYIFRIILVIFTFGLAAGIPCLEYMISLVGALCSSGLALIFPPVVEVISCLHKNQRHRLTVWVVIKNLSIFTLGLFGSVVGTFVAIQSIAEALSTSGGCGS